MLEKNFVVGAFQCNCRLLACPVTGEAILIDPGDEGPRLVRELRGLKTASGLPLQIKYLLHTHGHLDHVGGTRTVREAFASASGESTLAETSVASHPTPGSPKISTAPKIALHRGDEPLYLNLQAQGQLFGIKYEAPLPIDHYLEDGEEWKIGEMKFSMIHTPGHSPGSTCIRLHENSAVGIPEALFSGDTLFQQSVGRTDLWGGDQDLLFKSIRQRLLVLDDSTRVCPGHGNDTSIGEEKFNNPFVGGSRRP